MLPDLAGGAGGSYEHDDDQCRKRTDMVEDSHKLKKPERFFGLPKNLSGNYC
jgi:hypothetical protein